MASERSGAGQVGQLDRKASWELQERPQAPSPGAQGHGSHGQALSKDRPGRL